MTNRSPNILVIQADQMTPAVLPIYGHPLVQMPNLQRLAAGGVVFDNAYCNFPLCVPSRVSMLAGRLANSITAWDNAIEMPASIPTLAHYLRSLNYHTVLCGKMHFIGPDQVHGFNERITTDVYPSNFAWTPDWVVGERYRPTGINMRAVVDAGICVRGLQIDYDEEVAYSGVQKLYDLARFHTDNPFLLWVSFTHPHSPFVTTQPYWDLYDHDDIDMPRVAPIPLDEMDAMSRWLHYAHAGDRHTVTDEHVRNARHAYYGMCSYVDAKIGQLLKTLHETGLDENTMVVFTADHGEMLGERGMWFKQCFYEWSVRVPLVFHFPQQFVSRRVSELVSLVDLLPTFMDLASAGHPPEPVSPLDGASLVSLAQGRSVGWRDHVISEYTGEGVVAPCRMVRRGPYKYIYTHGYPPLLYDLQADPSECNNLADQSRFADLVADLQAIVLDDWAPEVIHAQCIQSQKERLFIQQTTGGEPNWAFRYRPDDGARYIRNAGAVETKAKSRYPFVEPTPFER
ncbi:MAG: choline-sulfatase [Candidatus Entotheonella factor]|uniref:Choline-sulfatase n=1 Tax=Entotheonella factor TaxID=1429438 RepID=W4LT64_ENTF1|nr:MAG: choline-sulfatase [Candidatus Entotheonella factor]